MVSAVSYLDGSLEVSEPTYALVFVSFSSTTYVFTDEQGTHQEGGDILGNHFGLANRKPTGLAVSGQLARICLLFILRLPSKFAAAKDRQRASSFDGLLVVGGDAVELNH